MRRRFELIVFDWDGTLADSTGLIVAGMQRAIAALGLEPRADETIRSLIGIGFREALAELYPGHDPAELEAALMALRQRAGGDGQQHAPLYPGVRPLLGRLHGHGYRLAVATGKSRAGLDSALDRHRGLRRRFLATRTADETAAKPDPRMLHELLAHSGVPPQRALMVGDTDYDMQMAAAAGVPAVAVAGGAHGHERLAASPAREVLSGIDAFAAWLDTVESGRNQAE
jgi:phosphoglycolate phosphatase